MSVASDRGDDSLPHKSSDNDTASARDQTSSRKRSKSHKEKKKKPKHAKKSKKEQRSEDNGRPGPSWEEEDYFAGRREAAAEENEWTEKLREFAAGDDYEERGWGGLGFDYNFQVAGRPAEDGEDEDAYAERIWRGMERRKAQKREKVGPATGHEWEQANAEQERVKARNAADAEARSRRILEEERARDAAWRQAALLGNLQKKRAMYESRWLAFSKASASVGMAEVPWPAENDAGLGAVVLHGAAGAEDRRKRLRAELLRWHPDRFVARFGPQLAPAERDAVLERVKEVSQALNRLADEQKLEQ